MKAKANERGLCVPENNEDDYTEPMVAERLDGPKNKPKFYDKDVINYDLMAKRLPMLKNLRGSKKKLQTQVFSEVDQIFDSIFQKNKSIFMTKGHVVQHLIYVAARMGEMMYLVNKNFERDALSIVLEENEELYKLYDKLDTVIETVKYFCEQKYQGRLSPDAFQKQLNKLIRTFKEGDEQKMAIAQIEDLLENDEDLKVKERLKKRRQRASEEKVLDLQSFR